MKMEKVFWKEGAEAGECEVGGERGKILQGTEFRAAGPRAGLTSEVSTRTA